jgi:hypothetical protein
LEGLANAHENFLPKLYHFLQDEGIVHQKDQLKSYLSARHDDTRKQSRESTREQSGSSEGLSPERVELQRQIAANFPALSFQAYVGLPTTRISQISFRTDCQGTIHTQQPNHQVGDEMGEVKVLIGTGV